MKDDVAKELLGRIMEWDEPQLAQHGATLQALARYKYDEYGTFRPGEHFLEALARWLPQFATANERRAAVDFVLRELVFISDAELEHAIELVYRDVVRPLVRHQVADARGIARHRLRQLTEAPEFRAFQRQLLVMGLSDGARLDRLRRASPQLSHEQFVLVPTPQFEDVERMCKKLRTALGLKPNQPARFRHVLLVDDFTGSGFTMLRMEPDGKGGEVADGKLAKVHVQLEALRKKKLLEVNAGVTVVTYVASEAARASIEENLRRASLPWSFRTIQLIPGARNVRDARVEALCAGFYDKILDDAHKGNAVMGYRDSRLPLVLTHNTPNNSICILWADTSENPKSSLRRHALFPRYERHSADRP